VYATGAWKVTDVFVKKNDCVTEGMVLAVVEKEDISLTLKQKELEILKLEKQYKTPMMPIVWQGFSGIW